MAQGPDKIVDRARRAIGSLLPAGRANLNAVATAVGTSPRSLQRHLDAAGQPFGQLLAEVRLKQAKAYLADGSKSISEIGRLLGFAAPSSFTRWFSRAAGRSPSAWRRGGRNSA